MAQSVLSLHYEQFEESRSNLKMLLWDFFTSSTVYSSFPVRTPPILLEVVMRYAGLSDEPKRRKQERGNTSDFRVMQQFTSETAARQWERRMLAQGYEEDTSGKGWKYGYTFSIRR
jgi:hypothetical protein